MNSIRKIKGPLILTLCALIWGTAFVFQSVGMDYIKPFSFLAARSFVGCIVLIPLIIVSRVKSSVHKPDTEKNWLKGGVVCGVVLFAASAFQQIGIQYTTAGEAGFLTALYIVIVPVLGIFMGKGRHADMARSCFGTYRCISSKRQGRFQRKSGCLVASSVLAGIFVSHFSVRNTVRRQTPLNSAVCSSWSVEYSLRCLHL